MKKIKQKQKNNVIKNDVKIPNLIYIIIAFIFLGLLFRASELALKTTIDGINLKEFASKRTTKKETILAKRATIYDANGDALARNIYSYTLVAYLSPSRGEGNYVKDKETTAKSIASAIGADYDYVLGRLNSGKYQTEFGSKGKNLTEIEKDNIAKLNLPGITFTESQTRYYPKGDFLSYTLGYAKQDETGKIIGEMGLEALFNSELTGTDGYKLYQKDLQGYKIANTKEEIVEAKDGNDIYLTIDSNIQFFVEQALNEVKEKYTFDELNIVIADAKTGKILAISSTTSFDPNKKNIKSYLDPNVATAIETGSTMKIFSYMAAMEAGVYNGSETFKSGIYKTTDGTEIGDWNRKGWGTITYDRGFALSSNTGVVNLIEKYMDGNTLKEYYKKLGFGSKTGIELAKETSGKLNFKYETEVYNAGFGQGILTTSIQNIKALTSIANDGILLQPYLVDKIVDQKGNVILKNTRQELERVASKKTTDKIKDLMEDVVTNGTGTNYKMEGYDLIAKTGTAQISSTNGTGYLKGEDDVIRGFAGMFPKDDPEIIIYANLKRPKKQSVSPLTYVIKDVVTNISKYLNIYDETVKDDSKAIKVKISSYYNKNVTEIKDYFTNQKITPVIIGNGTKIIKQYPEKESIITSDEKVFLITNDNNLTMPDLTGYSYKDAKIVLELLEIKTRFTNTGYVVSQSVSPNTDLKDVTEIEITLKEKFDLTKE